MAEYSMTICANSSRTVAKTADEFNEAVEKLIENERHITRIEVSGHLAPRVDYSRLTELFRLMAFVTVDDSECDGLTVALLYNALEDPDCKIIDVQIPRDADQCGKERHQAHVCAEQEPASRHRFKRDGCIVGVY
jgi:hypothetical protein